MKRLITLPILVLCVLMLVLMLTGCNEQQEALRAAPETSKVGTFDGCEVSFVNRGYQDNSFYMAKCPGNSTTTTRNYAVKSGKASVFKRSTVIAQEIEALQVEKTETESKEKALEKLSPAERKLLGL
jgi:uncharacterized lipoprotein NlpE involved in copper resistance